MASVSPDVLWALHDFEAEQQDEVSFKAGEKIIVVEKDDEFSDGWYTGTNEAGKTGLFPFAYTTTDRALALQSKLASTHLASGAEQAATSSSVQGSAPSDAAASVNAGAPKPGRRNSTDTDNFSIADTDAGTGGASGIQSEYVPPSGGRAALAASAQRNAAQENASEREAEARRKAAAEQQFEKEEQRQRALMEAAAWSKPTAFTSSGPRRQESALASNSLTSISSRSSAAPRIAPVAGMNMHYESDDSENEEGNGFDYSQLKHIHAPTNNNNSTSAFGTPRLNGSSASANLQAAAAAPPASSPGSAPNAAPAAVKLSSPANIAATPPTTTSISTPTISEPQSARPVPTPVRSLSHSSETGTVSQLPSSVVGPAGDPHEWSVDDVVEWGRSKGWDDATVLSKFREHEISGDVLMEMDVVILKEIDITAYGKRLKVANAIKELKRSIPGAANTGSITPQTPVSASGSRTPARVQLTPRRGSLGLPTEDSEQLQSPLYPPPSQLAQPQSASVPTSATSAHFAPGIDGLGHGAFGSHASIGSTSGSAGRGFAHGRVESVDRPRSAGGVSLTGSFGGTSANAGWPRSGPLELGFTGLGGVPHARALTDQGGSARGSTNGSARNLALDGTTAASSMDGDGTTLRSREEGTSQDRSSGSGGFLSGFKGSSSPASPNLRVTSGSSGGGRSVGSGERTSFFGLGPRNRKPAPKEAGEKTGTLSRLGLGKGSSNKDRTSSVTDLKDRISLPTSSPSYESTGDTARRINAAGIGISGAGLGAGDSPTVDSAHGVGTQVSPSLGLASPEIGGAPSGGRAGHSKQASVDSIGPEWNGIGTGPTSPLSPNATNDSGPVMARIRPVDFEGWIKKKTERYGTWKPRYMALKGPDLVLLRDPTAEKIKGYVSMKGYKVIADENTNPGKYGFKILHEHEKPHYFSSDDPVLVREWMKALMKSTIGRDHSFPVISSYNNATISLKEAQRMNPPPRPPSPTSRARVQRANARPNTQTLSAKDASVLMGLSSPSVPGRM
ncbi:hypothetical protein V8E36_006537 [Tilletia maclaganii]